MPMPSHQTIRLSRGRHKSPEGGACVMELASMLAGEPFDDHPRSVCPIVATFLRAYNDAVGDERRQDLYRFASAAVDTAGDRAASADRARECARWFANEVPAERRTRFFVDRPFPRLRRSRIAYATRVYARRTTDASHADALRFIEGLIARGPATTDGLAQIPMQSAGARQ
jgi:hypothetical protein